MRAVLCPVCSGSGEVADYGTTTTKQCHGCSGRGWVGVLDFIPFPPWVSPYPTPSITDSKGTIGITPSYICADE